MKSSVSNIKLTSVDDLFKTDESRTEEKREKVMDIPLSDLYPFKNHPFHVNDNEELHDLAKSIAENGMVTPAVARPRPEGGYELIAGHRRKAACKIAGIQTMPVLIRKMDDDTATIVMVDSNQQRENLLPSEKAFSYKMKLEAMKRQAGRPSHNSAQVEPNLKGMRSNELLAKSSEDSRATIQRYIRLTNLIPELLKMVDEKRIAFNSAVELSYLPEETQKKLMEIMDMQQSMPSLSQAQRMKKLSAEGKLNDDMMLQFLSNEKPNQKEKVSIRRERIERYFPKNYTAKQMEDTILKLLEDWQRKRQREREPSR